MTNHEGGVSARTQIITRFTPLAHSFRVCIFHSSPTKHIAYEETLHPLSQHRTFNPTPPALVLMYAKPNGCEATSRSNMEVTTPALRRNKKKCGQKDSSQSHTMQVPWNLQTTSNSQRGSNRRYQGCPPRVQEEVTSMYASPELIPARRPSRHAEYSTAPERQIQRPVSWGRVSRVDFVLGYQKSTTPR